MNKLTKLFLSILCIVMMLAGIVCVILTRQSFKGNLQSAQYICLIMFSVFTISLGGAGFIVALVQKTKINSSNKE